MKIVFMGTPDFAVPSLKSLINEFGVEAVFTQPDRPKGRGKKLGMSPVKEVALEHNIPVYQPLRLKNEPETIEELKNMEPDFRSSTFKLEYNQRRKGNRKYNYAYGCRT